MTYITALPCIDIINRACVNECPIDCIYKGEQTLYIRPDECVNCDACEPVYPVEAIYYEDDLPEERSVLESVNTELFDDIGSPDDAQRLGPTDSSHPYAAELPPQGE